MIGKNFNAAPEKFNYERLSNQDDINLNDTDWIRNTFPYALDKDNSGYDYVQESYTYSTQDSIIKFVNGQIKICLLYTSYAADE